MAGLQSELEERVVEDVRSRRDELVDLVGELVALDTTARDVDDPPRDEERLQRLLQARLEAVGAETDLWEPEPTVGDRFLPDALSFRGRPQLAAWLRGHGAGRSLLLLGHIDAVSAEPVDRWTSDPFRADVRDGKLLGRGACDMKGGLGAVLVALETLHRLGVRTDGDVVWCSVTDEESSGAGGVAAVAHGVAADAGICAEPTGFDTWVACRGSLTPIITIEGRPGHAEMTQPHWREGGAVNAIEKLPLVLEAIGRLRHEWRSRPDCRHPYLDPGDIVPTVLRAGEWSVTYPSEAVLTCEVTYLPTQVDADGTGKRVEREIHEAIAAAASGDPWLAEHPLRWVWDGDVVPAEIPADHPLVGLTMRAAADLGRAGTIDGFESWHDGATFIRAGTPTLCFGPGDRGALHRLDEFAPVDDLVDHAAAVALIVMRWCGVA